MSPDDSEQTLLDQPSSVEGAPEENNTEEAVHASALSQFGDDVLPKTLRAALENKGFTKLTSVQQSVVEADTDARDLRITSQTGSGKTVAVGIAIGRKLLKDGARNTQKHEGEFDPRAPSVLLLTPTRELAGQVCRELAWLFKEVPDAFVEVVTGGTSVGLERKSLARGPRMIVGTPGRVLDHLNNGGFKGEFITQVILDEADQMFDMGFREELQGILEVLPEERRTHLVSATFSGDVKRIAERHQKSPIFLEGSPLGAANSDIEHLAHLVGFRHRYDALINILLKANAEREENQPGRTLIFTRTRADTNEIAERLQRDGVRAEPLSGDLAQAQRTRTLSAFRSGTLSTLVATDVAARGLDVQGVDLVIHLDPPENSDTYTHRSGRTGRAGQKGTSVLLLPPQARARIERMLRTARINPTWAPVPTADKIRKLYTKLGRRRLFQALEEKATQEEFDYAQKLLQEHAAEQIIAQLLKYIDVTPPCLPRDITEHISSENGPARRRDERGFKGGAERGGPPRRPREGRFTSGGERPGRAKPSFSAGGPGKAGPGRPAAAPAAGKPFGRPAPGAAGAGATGPKPSANGAGLKAGAPKRRFR